MGGSLFLGGKRRQFYRGSKVDNPDPGENEPWVLRYRLLSQELETWRRDNPATLESARPVFELHEHYGEQATGFMAARTEVRQP